MGKPVAEQIKVAMKMRGISSPAELARKLRVSPQTAHQWYSGQTKNISAANLFRISDALNVSARWLLTGTGSMGVALGMSADELKAIELYRGLPPVWRRAWMDQGQTMLENLGNVRPVERERNDHEID